MSVAGYYEKIAANQQTTVSKPSPILPSVSRGNLTSSRTSSPHVPLRRSGAKDRIRDAIGEKLNAHSHVMARTSWHSDDKTSNFQQNVKHNSSRTVSSEDCFSIAKENNSVTRGMMEATAERQSSDSRIFTVAGVNSEAFKRASNATPVFPLPTLSTVEALNPSRRSSKQSSLSMATHNSRNRILYKRISSAHAAEGAKLSESTLMSNSFSRALEKRQSTSQLKPDKKERSKRTLSDTGFLKCFVFHSYLSSVLGSIKCTKCTKVPQESRGVLSESPLTLNSHNLRLLIGENQNRHFRVQWHISSFYIYSIALYICFFGLASGSRMFSVIDPQGKIDYWWSFVVSAAWLYNFWIIIYRTVFCDPFSDAPLVWIIPDYSADLIYLLDLVIQFRTSFLEEGVLVIDGRKLRHHYVHSKRFFVDCISIIPMDLLYFKLGILTPLRFLRLLKTHRYFKFIDRTERHTNSPNVIRLIKLALYLFAILHWNASLYHLIASCTLAFSDGTYIYGSTSNHLCYAASHDNNSTQEAINTTETVDAYLHALYWSTMFIIGQHPRPLTTEAYIFIIVEVLLGLLLFATVLGHITQIVASISADRKEFQGRLDAVKVYMRLRRVPKTIQERVIKWFDYLWICKRTADELKVLSMLPEKLRADIALHVHLETLKSVDFFQNSEEGFLSELVLKLRPVLYSPGDYICKKNEIGKEMYIITKGKLHVLADDGVTVLAVLKPGKYFGEISILNAAVGNRRTATVRSVGYSDLFCLSKKNLWDVLKDYPAERARLETIAAKRMAQFNAHNQQVLCVSRDSITNLTAASDRLLKHGDTASSTKPPTVVADNARSSGNTHESTAIEIIPRNNPSADQAVPKNESKLATLPTVSAGKQPENSDLIVAELNRLRIRIQYLETENAALSVKISNQEFSLLRRMEDLEFRFRNELGTSLSTSEEVISPNLDIVPPRTRSNHRVRQLDLVPDGITQSSRV